MPATFVYGDRVPPAGTSIPDENHVVRHKRILMTDQRLEEGDNMAVGLKLDPNKVYLGKGGSAHGSSSVLYAMNREEPVLQQLWDDIDVLNAAGIYDIPSKALTYSYWVREHPEHSSFPDDYVVIDNDIHGGWQVFTLEKLLENIDLKKDNKNAYGRWLSELLKDLASTDAIDHSTD